VRKCKLTAKTDARTSREGEITPAGAEAIPPLGLEGLYVRTKHILTSVHAVDVHQDVGTLLDEDWRSAIGTTAHGKHQIPDCLACILWDDRVHT
jgi:hypothetical protein